MHNIMVLKQDTSQPLFVKSEVLSKVTMINAFNLEPPRKLHECISCTGNATPWMVNNKKMCETTGLFFTHCHWSNYWSNNKFCQLSCFKSNNGYKGDDCCDNQTPVPCNIFTNDATPWMIKTEKCVNPLDLSLQNFIRAIIGETISFSNRVVSKLRMSTKGVTVVNIKLMNHATFSQMKKHHGWKQQSRM